jgi:hypothetical protein
MLPRGLAAGCSRRLFDGHRGAGAWSFIWTMGIAEMDRRGSRRGFVMLQDASEDIAVNDLSLFAGGGAEAGGSDAVDVAEAPRGGFVEQGNGIGMKELAVRAGTAQAGREVVGGILGT